MLEVLNFDMVRQRKWAWIRNPEVEDKCEYTDLGKCKAEISSDQDNHPSLPKANLQTLQSHLSW